MTPKPSSAPGPSSRQPDEAEAQDDNDLEEEAVVDDFEDFPNDDQAPQEFDENDANDAEIAKGVEEFLNQNRIDSKAADALRECGPDVQSAVLRRGSLSSARNPSSVLLARIRDASANFGGDGSAWVRMRGLPFEATKDEVTRFWQEWLDRKNFKSLSSSAVSLVRSKDDGRPTGEAYVQFATEEIARDAISQKNMDRIGGRYIELFVATTAEVRRHGIATGEDDEEVDATGEEDPEMESRIEEFIQKNNVDDRAAEALRSCSVHLQKQVIETGDLTRTRNPSSVVLSRIRDAQRYGGKSAAGPTEEEIEDFLRANDVDEAAEEAFRRCGVQLQRIVIEKGIISTARNPSSTLLARIRDARESLRQRSRSPQQQNRDQHRSRMDDDLDALFRQWKVDDRAAEACRRAPHWVREAVLKNDFSQARNPSSALTAFVKEKERQEKDRNMQDKRGDHPPRPPPPPMDGHYGHAPPYGGGGPPPGGQGFGGYPPYGGYGYGAPPGYGVPPAAHGDYRGHPVDYRDMGRADPRGPPDRRGHYDASGGRRYDERYERERYEAERRFDGGRPPEQHGGRRYGSREGDQRGGGAGGNRWDAGDRGRREEDRYGHGAPNYGSGGRRHDGSNRDKSRSRDRPQQRPRDGEYDRGDRRREGEWDRGHDFRTQSGPRRRSRSRDDRRRAPYDAFRPSADAGPPRPGPGPGPPIHPSYFAPQMPGAQGYGRDGYGGGGHHARDPLMEAVEHFISTAGVDKEAADAFRNAGPDIQRMVMDRSSIGGARNPSAMLLGCIRDARNDLRAANAGGHHGGGHHGGGGGQGHGGGGGGGGRQGGGRGPPRPSSRPAY